MGSGYDAVDALERIAFGLELIGAEPMRVRAFRNGARVAKKFGSRLEEAAKTGELRKAKGIGPALLAVIKATLAGEKVEPLIRLESEIPPDLFEARKLPGIGPKKVATLWRELGATSLAAIEYACNENRLVDLPGFGAKTQARVLEALNIRSAAEGFFRRDQAMARTQRFFENDDAFPSGAFRRGVPVLQSVEAVVLGEAQDWCARVGGTIDGGAVVVDADGVALRICCVADPSQFGAIWAFETASPGHRQALVFAAEARGLHFSREGLSKNGEALACANEAKLYELLGFELSAEERREADAPLTPLGSKPESLVSSSDLLGALHNHTTASDGVSTLSEMQTAAADYGLRYLGISEHSHSAVYAGGLSTEALLAQVEAIAGCQTPGQPRLLAGVETDILEDGALDYSDDVLGALDFVVASVHARHRQSSQAMTARLIRAARHPAVDVIGHPTGRLLLGRPESVFEMDDFLDACLEGGTAVELNAHPQRLDLDEVHLVRAKQKGVKVSISADAHSAAALSHLDYGVTAARRAGLSRDDILNAMTCDEFREWRRRSDRG